MNPNTLGNKFNWTGVTLISIALVIPIIKEIAYAGIGALVIGCILTWVNK